ncbi:MAG: prepilin-type N-terminal cleavage/methylation domain-containing protein [Rhodocyclaceae bacterium]|nr:MAG: prepilin-type N-terminal cleavage/methylation domain-containing protein [Rhodocyclaceae bacterium]
MRLLKRMTGFTILELMITIAIIAVLVGIALPYYNDYIMRGKLSEAFSNLSDAQNRMEQYYQDNRSYGPDAATCGIPPSRLQAAKFFTFTCTPTCTGSSCQGYTYTANGINGMDNFQFTVNEAGTKATLHVAPGWTGQGANCWVTTKGGC